MALSQNESNSRRIVAHESRPISAAGAMGSAGPSREQRTHVDPVSRLDFGSVSFGSLLMDSCRGSLLGAPASGKPSLGPSLPRSKSSALAAFITI